MTRPTMHPHNPRDLMDDEAANLSDPVIIEEIVTSDAFIDWNVELAINGIHLPPQEGARIFLQLHPNYTMGPLEAISIPLPVLPPDLPDLWRLFVDSDWHRNNEHEPKIAGYSVLRQMLAQESDPTDIQSVWICCVPNPSRPNGICGQAFRRWDRAITHIRGKHLNHRPYLCHGGCGVQTWYVISPALPAVSLMSSKPPSARSVSPRKRTYTSIVIHRLKYANGTALGLFSLLLSDTSLTAEGLSFVKI